MLVLTVKLAWFRTTVLPTETVNFCTALYAPSFGNTQNWILYCVYWVWGVTKNSDTNWVKVLLPAAPADTARNCDTPDGKP